MKKPTCLLVGKVCCHESHVPTIFNVFVTFHTWNTNPILDGWSVFYLRANFCHMANLFYFILFYVFKIENFLKMAEFYPKFQWVANNKRRVLKVFYFHNFLNCQIWLNHLIDDHHFSYITKLKKKLKKKKKKKKKKKNWLHVRRESSNST